MPPHPAPQPQIQGPPHQPALSQPSLELVTSVQSRAAPISAVQPPAHPGKRGDDQLMPPPASTSAAHSSAEMACLNELLFPDMDSPVQKQYRINGQQRQQHGREPSPHDGQRRQQHGREPSPHRGRDHSRERQKENSFQLVVSRNKKRPAEATHPVSFSILDSGHLPGKFYNNPKGKIAYDCPIAKDTFIFNQPKLFMKHNNMQRYQLHASTYVLNLESLLRPELPRPAKEMAFELANNHLMCLKPKTVPFVHSFATPCDCLQHGVVDTHHRQSVVPLTCAKRGLIRSTDLEVPMPASAPKFSENPQHSYCYSEEARTHLLSVSQPYPLNVRWPAKVFKPAFASCTSERHARAYSVLFDSESYKNAAGTYMAHPGTWDQSTNPYYSEPAIGSELHFVTRELYALETLFRTSFVRHPAKEDSINVFSLVDLDLQLPVLDLADKFALDDLLTETLRPFYQRGAGRILCAVCLFEIPEKSDLTMPLFLTRSAYVAHYRQYHWDHSIVTGLHSATQLNTRHYQCNLVYVLCLPFSGVEDDPKAVPFELDISRHEGLRMSDLMLDLIKKPGMRKRKPVADVLGPLCVNLMDDQLPDGDVSMEQSS